MQRPSICALDIDPLRKHTVTRALKKLTIGTPFDRPLRATCRAVTPRPADDIRHDRDSALVLAKMRSYLTRNANCRATGRLFDECLDGFPDSCPDADRIAIEPLAHFAKNPRQKFPEVEIGIGRR